MRIPTTRFFIWQTTSNTNATFLRANIGNLRWLLFLPFHRSSRESGGCFGYLIRLAAGWIIVKHRTFIMRVSRCHHLGRPWWGCSPTNHFTPMLCFIHYRVPLLFHQIILISSTYLSNQPKQLFPLILVVLKPDFDEYLRDSSHTRSFIFSLREYFADTVLSYRIEVK